MCEFSTLLSELGKEANQATWFIGFLKSTMDNPVVSDRLDGSACEYAGVTACVGVRESVILFCNRSWDKGPDSISLVRAFAELPDVEEFEARKQGRKGSTLNAKEKERLKTAYQEFKEALVRAESRTERIPLRVLRSEYLAHRVLESRDRIKAEEAGMDVDGATYAGLLELAEETVNLVGKLAYLWDQVVNPYPDRIERATRIAEEFWRLLPVFKDVERPIF